jgi:serine/threonine-protein kinase
LDFGIAKLMRDSNPRLTQSGVLLGTPRYMAPEQVAQRTTDERTDIYALGLIGYELLTGQVPFEAENTVALLVRVSNEEAVAPSRRSPGVAVSAATEALIMRCLAKDPARRFQSAQALREALAAIPREAAPGAASVRLHLAARDTSLPAAETRRFRTLLRVVGAALLLCAVGGAGAAWLRGARHTVQLTAASRDALSEPLSVAEWIQGIPFPAGVQFKRFEPEWIDARVPASSARVFAFYRVQLSGKWGGFRDLDGVLVFEDSAALIKTLTVGPAENGSRVSIARRPARTP